MFFMIWYTRAKQGRRTRAGEPRNLLNGPSITQKYTCAEHESSLPAASCFVFFQNLLSKAKTMQVNGKQEAGR